MKDNTIYANLFKGDNTKIIVNVRATNGRTTKQIIIDSDGNVLLNDKEDKNNGR